MLRYGLVLLAAVASLVISAGAAMAGPPDYCSATADNVVVYVDKTTPYDETDKTALVHGISRLYESLTGGERFAIRTIADSFTASATLLDACVPYCPDGGMLDIFFSDCTEGRVINDKKHLRDEVVRQLRGLLANFVELPNSEIIRTVARTVPAEMRSGQATRLYLFTDLIENSVYLPGRDFFSTRNDTLLARLKSDGLVPDLTGVAVHVFGVGRAGTADRRPLEQELLQKLLDFWQAYFAEANAAATIQQSLGAVN